MATLILVWGCTSPSDTYIRVRPYRRVRANVCWTREYYVLLGLCRTDFERAVWIRGLARLCMNARITRYGVRRSCVILQYRCVHGTHHAHLFLQKKTYKVQERINRKSSVSGARIFSVRMRLVHAAVELSRSCCNTRLVNFFSEHFNRASDWKTCIRRFNCKVKETDIYYKFDLRNSHSSIDPNTQFVCHYYTFFSPT